MNSRAFAAVAVVFLGMLSFLFSVNVIQAIITMPYYPEEIEGKASLVLLAYILPAFVLVGTGFFLILKRHQIADWILAGSPVEDATKQGNLVGLPALLFTALGIYLVVTTLPTIGGLATRLIFTHSYSSVEEAAGIFWSNAGHYLGTLAQFVIGAYLFFSARKLEQWWFSRDAVEPEPVPTTPDLPTCPQCGTPYNPAHYRFDLQEKRCSKCKASLPESEFSNA